MSEPTQVRPTVVFRHNNGPIHLVDKQDAVPSRDEVVVTTVCGQVGIGQVKLRKVMPTACGECYRKADDG